MGPFELMDLVGVDIGLDISRSFYEQSFGEPRWRPSPITVKTVAAGRYGRKSGRGYYDYPEGERHRPEDADPPAPGGGDGVIVIAGETQLAMELAYAADAAGWDDRHAGAGPEPRCAVPDPRSRPAATSPRRRCRARPQAICLHAGSLAALDPGGSAVGFHALPPLEGMPTRRADRRPRQRRLGRHAAERFFRTLGKHTEWVSDAPGLVLGRIVCQVINEAAFALGEGVGSPEDIDAGMIHGLNYPRGILAWADAIGLDHVLGVLDALNLEYGEERYRAAPTVRRLALSGRLGRPPARASSRTTADRSGADLATG